MDKKRRIAYALVQLMDEHDTQGKELAKYLGVKPSAISNYQDCFLSHVSLYCGFTLLVVA